MRFCSLSSCSRAGSAYLIEGGDGTRVLVDCGPGIRRLEADLWAHGVDPASLSGVLVTHGHSDHIRALCLKTPFPLKHRVPLFASRSVIRLVGGNRYGAHVVTAGDRLTIGGLEVTAFAKAHDCPEPLGFAVTDGCCRAAVVTDLGRVTREMSALLRDTTYLIFEANHDVDLELGSGRPFTLIRRVLGDHGHLSNDQAGQALAEIVGPGTRMVLLAHLSDECNTPALAYETVARHLDQAGYAGGLGVAPLFGRSCAFTAGHTPRSAQEAVG